MNHYSNELVESFVEEVEEIALLPEKTFNHDGDYTGRRTLDHDQEDSVIPTGPKAPSPLKEERDL